MTSETPPWTEFATGEVVVEDDTSRAFSIFPATLRSTGEAVAATGWLEADDDDLAVLIHQVQAYGVVHGILSGIGLVRNSAGLVRIVLEAPAGGWLADRMRRRRGGSDGAGDDAAPVRSETQIIGDSSDSSDDDGYGFAPLLIGDAAWVVREVAGTLKMMLEADQAVPGISMEMIGFSADGEVRLQNPGAMLATRKWYAGGSSSMMLSDTGLLPHYLCPETLTMTSIAPPEQAPWSLGILVYELLVGEPPMADTHLMRALFVIPSRGLDLGAVDIAAEALDLVGAVCALEREARLGVSGRTIALDDVLAHPFFGAASAGLGSPGDAEWVPKDEEPSPLDDM
ncbi:serine/threonine protein kinase [Thecamonas trahens ATCC 50062]|uniref:Serine/threonine protein kinase n=1 Tax=Thecamonas trahens ATCC 50062 TaxID=461836 RepID=A0A0L0D7C9_THETB|nr:serine/threonine protein kinase [Thecamonas trahens ATCC 50062]KNC47203.1 serine/threonine protein kinase [Thecamonas trahens ATCC 50062]|eukprot:XP_013759972.1 serine/threonine protein kinase [Thecamonas trahens ATCC 50062]